MRFALVLALLFPATAALSGCGRHYIANTDVTDTPQNRDVVEFCEDYRHAVERRNVALLLSLAHPNYYEDGGNIDASDDIDFAGLGDFLQDKFGETRGIRYEIRYRRVQANADETIFVDYTFSASYKVGTGEGEEEWRRQVADNRLELVADGDTYKILAGM